MNTKPTIRLHLFFARENARAVILRQGPGKVFRMILWDRDTDTFEDGQWVKSKVYVDVCDLSPDGQHFIYFMLDGRWDTEAMGSYTVISHPPWFTALALYPQGDTWGGGGRFIGNDQYLLNTNVDAKDIVGHAKGLERVYQVAPSREIASGIVRRDGSRAPLSREVRLRLTEGDSWSPPIDRYDTMGGVLYRCVGHDLEVIRDFTEMEFEPMRAPYDRRGDGTDVNTDPEPWHPLDGENE